MAANKCVSFQQKLPDEVAQQSDSLNKAGSHVYEAQIYEDVSEFQQVNELMQSKFLYSSLIDLFIEKKNLHNSCCV